MDILIIIIIIFSILSRFGKMIQDAQQKDQQRRQQQGSPRPEEKRWNPFDVDWKELLEEQLPKEERRVKVKPKPGHKSPSYEDIPQSLRRDTPPGLQTDKIEPAQELVVVPKQAEKPSIEVDFSPQGVMQGIIMQEILQPPRALRKLRR